MLYSPHEFIKGRHVSDSVLVSSKDEGSRVLIIAEHWAKLINEFLLKTVMLNMVLLQYDGNTKLKWIYRARIVRRYT